MGLLVLVYDRDIPIKYSEPEKVYSFYYHVLSANQTPYQKQVFYAYLIISSTRMLDAVDNKSYGKPRLWVVSSTTYLHSSFSSPTPAPIQWVPTLSPSVE